MGLLKKAERCAEPFANVDTINVVTWGGVLSGAVESCGVKLDCGWLVGAAEVTRESS